MAIQQKIQVGMIGVEIFLETGLNLATASGISINYRKPDGATGSFTGTAATKPAPRDNTRYGAKYVTASADDLDQVGEWEFQVSVVMTGFTGAGEVATLMVNEAL